MNIRGMAVQDVEEYVKTALTIIRTTKRNAIRKYKEIKVDPKAIDGALGKAHEVITYFNKMIDQLNNLENTVNELIQCMALIKNVQALAVDNNLERDGVEIDLNDDIELHINAKTYREISLLIQQEYLESCEESVQQMNSIFKVLDGEFKITKDA